MTDQIQPIPQFPKKLPGAIWAITAFFNPAGYKNKYRNFIHFRKSIQRQGLKLLAVELSFEGKREELRKKDADIVIQIKTNRKNVLWQKEALLNIAINKLPEDCDKVAWLDCDVIFENNDWVTATSIMLEKYVVIQPFNTIVRLDQGETDITDANLITDFALNGKKWFGLAYGVANYDEEDEKKWTGHEGYAWAARREIFKDLGFYDSLILGSGDTVIGYAFYKYTNWILDRIIFNNAMKTSYMLWRDEIFQRVQGSVFYVPGVILHLWHGNYRNRKYGDRHRILVENNFHLDEDITKDAQGILCWNSNKPNLHSAVRNYFYTRKEQSRFYIQGISIEQLNRQVAQLLGFCGKNLKNLSPDVYYLLKKYFPDHPG